MLEKIILSLSIVVVFIIIGYVSSYFVKRLAPALQIGRQNVYNLFSSIIKLAFISIGIFTALGSIGIDITALIASFGLLGLAVGLALKDSVSNVVSGLLILLYQPFKQGDTIEVGSTRGIVGEIDMRYVHLYFKNDKKLKEVLIPNCQIFNSIIKVENPLEDS